MKKRYRQFYIALAWISRGWCLIGTNGTCLELRCGEKGHWPTWIGHMFISRKGHYKFGARGEWNRCFVKKPYKDYVDRKNLIVVRANKYDKNGSTVNV